MGREKLKRGDICSTKIGAPARYLGDGMALFISAMCNDLGVAEAAPAIGGEERFPLPTDDEMDKMMRWINGTTERDS